MCAISSEGVTPPSSLLRAHVPLPLGSLLLQHLTSSKSLCRFYAVPAAHGSFPTLSLKVLPWMLDPVPRRYTCALTCFFHSVIGLPQAKIGSAVSVYPTNNDFSQARVSRMQIFRNVPASKFAHPPDRPYRCEHCRRAAGAFTSGPIVLGYLHTVGSETGAPAYATFPAPA